MNRHALVAWLLAAIFTVELLIASTTMSATCDECGHLAGGTFLWDFGSFDVYRVNPPLVRTLAAAPAVSLGIHRDYSRYREGPAVRMEWWMGQDLIAANPHQWEWYFIFGRWAVIPLLLIGTYHVYRWSRELYGETGGLLALSLWCFCPNVIAWGATFTPDAAAAAIGVTAGYSFWRWLRMPSWRHAVTAGAWLGVAELIKFSWVILFLLWPILWVFWRRTALREKQVFTIQERSPAALRDRSPSVMQLGTILFLALYVINLGYGFTGTCRPLRDYVFVSQTLAGNASTLNHNQGGNLFKETLLGQIPIPLPDDFVRGIDLQKLDFERGMSSYLNGEWSNRGWWYYYLYSMMFKIPLGTWLLAAIVALKPCCGIEKSRPLTLSLGSQITATWRDEIVLLTPAIVLFVFVSSQTGFSRYFRYVLPCLPFFYVWIGQVAWLLTVPLKERVLFPVLSGVCWLSRGALGWSIASSLVVFPFSMSYFNELAGSPRGGHRYLIDANIDWGQDMFHLRNWLRDHPEAAPIGVAYVCYVSPKAYGIDYHEVPEVPTPGWFAMSIHRIHDEGDKYAFFLKYEPVAMAGYSIYIYHVSLDDANRVRRELGFPELPSEDAVFPVAIDEGNALL